MKTTLLKKHIADLGALTLKLSTTEEGALEQLVKGLNSDIARIEGKAEADETLKTELEALIAAESEALSVLAAGAVLAKKAGIYPFDFARAIALNLFESGRTEVIKEDIEQLFEASEPELTYLIMEQIKAISEFGLKIEDEERSQKIRKAYELGFEYEGTYRGCAQCVIASLFETTGNSYPVLFRAASSMGGGTALCGDGSCGGYNGGILTIGSYVGRRLENFGGDADEKTKSVALCQALHDRFVQTYDGVTCRDVHEEVFNRSYVLRKPEDKVAFEAAGAYTEKCNAVVGLASAWTMQLLFDNGYVK